MTNFIPRLSLHIAKSIRKHHEGAASEDILKYALIVFINTLSIIASVLLVCSITGHVKEGGIVLLCFALLRYFSGGVHLHSSDACTLISSVMLILIAHTPFAYWQIGFILNAAALILIGLLAPKGLEEHRKINPSYLWVYKLLALIIVGINFYIQDPILAMTFFIQTLTLTRPAYTAVRFLERRGNV